MLNDAHANGVTSALARFKIKNASVLGRFGRGLRNMATSAFVGEAPRVFVEGSRTFRPGGALHYKNVLWPDSWAGRIGNVAMLPMMLPGIAHQDENEGALTRALGGAGSLAGMMYGGMAGGMLGQPIGMALGHGLGKGVGHLLGSHPKDQNQ